MTSLEFLFLSFESASHLSRPQLRPTLWTMDTSNTSKKARDPVRPPIDKLGSAGSSVAGVGRPRSIPSLGLAANTGPTPFPRLPGSVSVKSHAP